MRNFYNVMLQCIKKYAEIKKVPTALTVAHWLQTSLYTYVGSFFLKYILIPIKYFLDAEQFHLKKSFFDIQSSLFNSKLAMRRLTFKNMQPKTFYLKLKIINTPYTLQQDDATFEIDLSQVFFNQNNLISIAYHLVNICIIVI